MSKNNAKLLLVSSSLLVVTMFVGAGCSSLTNLFNKAAETTADVTASKMTETEYYNKAIQGLNNMSDETGRVQDSYGRFTEATTADTRAITMINVNSTFYDMAKKDMVDDKPVMENAEAQAKIEAKLTPYFSEYKTMLDANNALADYYLRGRYKDDAEAKKDELSGALSGSIDKVFVMQTELFDLIEQYQDKVDLGIDESTTDPLEVITLAQDKITNAAEKVYEDYGVWVEAYNVDTKTADIAPLETDYKTLADTYTTYKTKGEAVNAKDVTIAGSSYTSYMSAVDKFNIKFENLIRDAKGNSIADLVALDEEVVELYNDVIDTHNSLVTSVQSASALPEYNK
ncbi:MAG: DUF3829 domain-containing protein [Patescibacteria group bacterium]|jgi:hypothetical protein